MKNVTINSDHYLAFLDVVFLFTNVPIDCVKNSIAKKWNSISRETRIPPDKFLTAVNLILFSTYFSYNKVYYKQIFDTSMGLPLSPIIADLVLQDLEREALDKLPFNLLFYFRYVDDILLAAPKNEIDRVLTEMHLICCMKDLNLL